MRVAVLVIASLEEKLKKMVDKIPKIRRWQILHHAGRGKYEIRCFEDCILKSGVGHFFSKKEAERLIRMTKKERELEDKPLKNKVYQITGGKGEKCLSIGNSWEDSEIEKQEPIFCDCCGIGIIGNPYSEEEQLCERCAYLSKEAKK